MAGPSDTPDPGQLVMNALFGMSGALAPAGTPEKTVVDALEYVFAAENTPEYAQAFEALFGEKANLDNRFGVRLHPASGGKYLQLTGPKRLSGEATKPQELFGHVMVLGIFTSPVVRAALALHGWRIEFIEAVEKKPGPILVR